MNKNYAICVILIIVLCINGCIKQTPQGTKNMFIDEIVYIPTNEYRAIEIIGCGDGTIQFDAKEINGKKFWIDLVSSSEYEKIVYYYSNENSLAPTGIVGYATACGTNTYSSEKIPLKKGLYFLCFQATNMTIGTRYDLNIDLKVYQVE